MRPRPQRSPLFPYTTLFRSQQGSGLKKESTRGIPALLSFCSGYPDYAAFFCRALSFAQRARCVAAILDRKSTRLNSSHEWISYAVFCLKKKKLVLVILHKLI